MAGPFNARVLAAVLVGVMLAGATSGAYVLAAAHTATPGRATPLRVMPLGDSITLGPDAEGTIGGGWRTRLWEQLVVEEHRNVQFVGSQRSGTPPLDHEGHGGWRIDEIRAIVDGALAAAAPDVVLLHIGTNDIGQNHALDTASDRLRNLAARICADRPGVVLMLASIIPIGGLDPVVDHYNATIAPMVGALQLSGCDARFVDMHNAVLAADLFDGVHPDPAGYSAMAAVWYPALRDVYDDTAQRPAGSTAGSVDDDVLGYVGHWAHDRGMPGAYLADEHQSDSTGDTATWAFRGTSVELRGTVGPTGGEAAVSIDGGPDVPVDYYAPDPAEQVSVFRSAALTDAVHTMRVRVTGENNPASTDTVVSVDRLVIGGGSG